MRRGASVSPRLLRSLGLASLAVLPMLGACEKGIENKPLDQGPLAETAPAEALEDRQAALSEQASRYMELRQKGRWEEIWSELVDPEVRARMEREKYLSRRKSTFDIVDFEIISVDLAEGTGTVVVSMNANLPILKPGGAVMELNREVTNSQNWVWKDGSWYIQLNS